MRRKKLAEIGSVRSGAAPPSIGPSGGSKASQLDILYVDKPALTVLAVPDFERGQLSAADRVVLGAARRIADVSGADGAVAVLLCLAPGDVAPDDLGTFGADRLLLATDPDFAGYAAETRATAVAAARAMLKASHVVFGQSRFTGGDLARRVAARTSASFAAAVLRVEADGTVIRPVDGSRLDARQRTPEIVVIDTERFPLGPATDQRREARALTLDMERRAPLVRDLGLRPVDPRTLPLAEAEMVIAAGDGVSDFDAFHALADALQAAEGGSRVVCDAGLLPRDRQVGASGTVLSAPCYLAFGISGSAQHLFGIADCGTVIAVNTDLHADMVKRADLAIIADAQTVMPALARLLARRPDAA